jgi:hypothetical protein
LFTLAGVACDSSSTEPPPLRAAGCRNAEENASVGGRWTISGSGRREKCGERKAGTFQLRGMMVLHMVQRPDPDQPDTDLLVWQPREEIEGGVEVTGRVAGNCVDFDLVRELDGERLAFLFRGEVKEPGVVGEFTGTEREGCKSRGTFEVEIPR